MLLGYFEMRSSTRGKSKHHDGKEKMDPYK